MLTSTMFSVLSLLKLVRFTNFVCNATSGSNGTCYTSAECSRIGGVEEGTCADGYGVCCVGEYRVLSSDCCL